MKKKLLYWIGAAICGSVMSGCGESGAEQNISYPSLRTYQLATDTETGDIAVSEATYSASFDSFSGKASLTASNTLLPGGSKLSFTAVDMNYNILGDVLNSVIVFESNFPKLSAGSDVTNLRCALYTSKNVTLINGVEFDIPGVVSIVTKSLYPVISYKYKNYEVATFWPDMTYRGTSYITDIAGIEKQNKDISYRIIMNLSDYRNYTADLYIANLPVKGEDGEEIIKVMRFKNLPLEFSRGGIKISGSGLIPEVLTSGLSGNPVAEYEKNTLYRIDHFEYQSMGDLTGADINYELAGQYSVRFSGSYLRE